MTPSDIYSGLGLAGLIACGAVLQAGVSAGLVRRLLGFPHPLDTDKEIVKFLLLIGPLGCLINAAIGTAALLLFGKIGFAQTLFNFMNWWVGDSIGAIIVTPLCFVFFAVPREPWRQRGLTLGLPLLGIFALVIAAFVWASASQQKSISLTFENQAESLGHAVQRTFDTNLEVVHSLADYISSHPNLDRQNFTRYTSRPIKRHPGLQALEWIPRVKHKNRAHYEARARRDGHHNYKFTERDETGKLIRRKKAKEYFPVYFVEPYSPNKSASGFDLSSNPTRLAALKKSRVSKTAIATGRIRLIQEQGSQYGFLVFVPIFEGSSRKQDNLLGFALAVYRVGDILSTALKPFNTRGVFLTVRDKSAKPENALLYTTRKKNKLTLYKWLFSSHTLKIGTRDWEIKVEPDPKFAHLYRSWQPWVVLLGGLLVCCALCIFLLIITGYTLRIESLVKRRTKDLGRLKEIMDATPDFVATADANLHPLYVNHAALQFLGLSKETGQFPSIRDAIAPHSHHELEENAVPEALKNGYWEGEIIFRGRNKEDHVFSTVILCHRDNKGELQYISIIARDISERKRVERLKDEFVSIVSHELRTPLTSIHGSLGLVSGGALGALTPKQSQMLEIALNNSERLNRLINDLLDVQKIEAGQMKLSIRPCRLREILNTSVQNSNGYAGKYDVSLDLHPVNKDLIVMADPDRIQQVLMNLISNAIKYSPKSKPVEIHHKQNENVIRISVQDYGPGIPLNYQKKIFEKFTQADSSDQRAREGTGLGLSICKGIMEGHESAIGFKSKEGEGTVFWFELKTTS